MLEGSWALCVLHRGEPDKFWATRKDSPLVLGLGEGENLAASDIPAILGHTREIALLEDKEIAEVRADGVRILTPASPAYPEALRARCAPSTWIGMWPRRKRVAGPTSCLRKSTRSLKHCKKPLPRTWTPSA